MERPRTTDDRPRGSERCPSHVLCRLSSIVALNPQPSTINPPKSLASVPSVSPLTLSAQDHIRPVSCYALFQWWLLLSQHPGCLRAPTSFYTELGLGTLAEGLGCFPLDREAYPPQSHSRASRTGIRSLVDFG